MSKARAKTYVVPGFHSDVVWLEDQRDYARVLFSDLRQNLLVVRSDPDYGFFVHELTYLKPYGDIYPEHRDELRRLIAAGRVGTAGSHSQAAETLIGGEALVRNIVYGRLYHERVMGDRPEVYASWDVFGHCAQLAQICAKSRFIGAIWSKRIVGARAVFWHQALNGTKLLFKHTNYSFKILGILKYEDFHARMAEAFEEIRRLGLRSDVRLDCLDFRPPKDWIAGRAGELSVPGHEFVVTGTGEKVWFRETLKEVKRKRLWIPTVARDYEFYHQGTGVSRIELKLANRLAENLLASAEKFATIAWLYGADYPDAALDKAWRQVLFSQHHDIVTGASCDRGYLDVMASYREACELAQEVYRDATVALAEAADTESGAPKGAGLAIVVFNPLNWRRTETVRVRLEFKGRRWRGFRILDSQGRDVACELESAEIDGRGYVRECEVTLLVRDVPSLGYKTVYAVRATELPEARRKVRGSTIENEFFSVTADAKLGGGITSIYDKEAGRELVNIKAGPANELVALEEDGNIEEPSWELWTKGPKYFSRNYAGKVEVWKGPLSERLVIGGDMKDCRRRQEVVLNRGVRRIDFVTRLENYDGLDHLYVVTFPVKLEGLEPVFEDRFGATVKRRSKGKLDFRTYRPENRSNCGARQGNQWVELSSSATLRFGERSAYSLGMVNIVYPSDRTAVQAAEMLQEALIKLGIPVTPWQDDLWWPKRKDLRFENTILPKPEDFYADLAYGTSFRVCLDVGGRNSYAKKLLSQVPASVRRRFKEALRGKGVAYLFLKDRGAPRGWEALPVLLISASEGRALLRAVRRLAKDFCEDAGANLPEEADISGLNGQVDGCGFGILNRGHVMASVECDSTMVLFLMRTAKWGVTPWGKDRLPFFLVPEHRTHVYRYAAYPHQGDWREAMTYRRSREFNNPLRAVCTKIHGGRLKREMEFLGSDIESFVITAVKPCGYATAGFEPDAVDRKKGITVRGYEASGRPTAGKLSFQRPLRAAFKTNLLEERESEVALKGKRSAPLELGAFEIETMQVMPSVPRAALKGRKLGRKGEAARVIHFRHWDHNKGAAPIGYGAVAMSLHGDVSLRNPIRQGGITINEMRVAVTNNYVKRSVEGDVEFELPGGWRTHPERIRYRLSAGEGKEYKVLVITPPAGVPRQGIIKARIIEGGQVFQDVLYVDDVPRLRWEVTNGLRNVTVRIENDWEQSIEGEVDLISPMESWGKELVGEESVVGFGPLSKYFEVKGKGAAELVFPISPGGISRRAMRKSVWAVAKLSYHGKVEYKPVPFTSVPADEGKLLAGGR